MMMKRIFVTVLSVASVGCGSGDDSGHDSQNPPVQEVFFVLDSSKLDEDYLL